MKPQINLVHLKYFYDAVTCQSITHSAEKNHVTQSTVSQGITKLEICLGVPLLIHNRQKFVLTEDGKIVFEQAHSIFNTINVLHKKIEARQGDAMSSLKFVTTRSLGMILLDSVKEKSPQVEMHHRMGNLDFIKHSLLKGEADFGIVVYDETFSQFSRISLYKGHFNLYCHKKAEPDISGKGILVDYGSSLHVETFRNEYLKKHKSPLKIDAEMGGWMFVAQGVSAKMGVGLLPDYLLKSDLFPNMVLCEGRHIPKPEYEICAIYNKETQLSDCAKAFFKHFTLP